MFVVLLLFAAGLLNWSLGFSPLGISFCDFPSSAANFSSSGLTQSLRARTLALNARNFGSSASRLWRLRTRRGPRSPFNLSVLPRARSKSSASKFSGTNCGSSGRISLSLRCRENFTSTSSSITEANASVEKRDESIPIDDSE